jgi:molecular chaperone GrpE
MVDENKLKQAEGELCGSSCCSNCECEGEAPLQSEGEITEQIDLQEELTAKNQQIEELNNQYLRLQADFENYRRRTLLEKEGLVEMVTESFVKDFLPIIDNFERAVDSAKSTHNIDSLIQGLEMALNKFQEELVKKKVTSITVKIGEQFDPEQQEVIMTEQTDDYPENTVIEELQKGYTIETKFGTKLIRPALVKITKQAD